MYTINVNNKYKYELAAGNDHIKLNDQPLDLDLRELKDGHLHVIYRHKSYTVEVVSGDGSKTMTIKINGRVYEIAVDDQYDSLLKAMGMMGTACKSALEIKAPMPGLVLSVNVTVGQEIKKGDSLLVLEAMKMENMLKSTTDGIVKTILVNKGDKVEKNQVLIGF